MTDLPDTSDFAPIGWTDDAGLTIVPTPATVTVKLADWIAPFADNPVLTGGIVEGDMVRFPQRNGAIFIRRDVLGLQETR